MFRVTVTKNDMVIKGDDLLTSGSVKTNYVSFTFDKVWDGVLKTAVFRTKKLQIPVIIDDEKLMVSIPWEVLAFPKETVELGIYGTRSDNEETSNRDEEIIIPTIWGTLGKIVEGVALEDPPATLPTKDSYRQLLDYLNEMGPGQNGLTPFINDQGHWQIGDEDTGVSAMGDKGDKGNDGQDGLDALEYKKVIELDGVSDNIDEWMTKPLTLLESDFNRALNPDGTDSFLAPIQYVLTTGAKESYLGVFTASSLTNILLNSYVKTQGKNGENSDGEPGGSTSIANLSTMRVILLTLYSNQWIDNEQAVTINRILEDEKTQLIVPIPRSSNKELYKSYRIEAISQGENLLTFFAETAPSENLDVYVYIFEAGSGKPDEGDNNDGNIYSTDETRIGTWINGKPIYRKIIVGDTSETEIGYISGDIDTILFLDGIVNSQYGFPMPINGGGGTWYILTQVNMETGYIEFTTNQSAYKNQYIHICVEYTKKRDMILNG